MGVVGISLHQVDGVCPSWLALYTEEHMLEDYERKGIFVTKGVFHTFRKNSRTQNLESCILKMKRIIMKKLTTGIASFWRFDELSCYHGLPVAQLFYFRTLSLAVLMLDERRYSLSLPLLVH